MPLPIIWAIVAGGAAFVAWKYRKKIQDFLESDAGQVLLNDLKKAGDGYIEPYRKILEEAYFKTSDQRKIFFSEAKKKMSGQDWAGLIGYAKSNRDTSYIATIADLFYIDKTEK